MTGKCSRCDRRNELKGGICGDCGDDLRMEADANRMTAEHDAAEERKVNDLRDEALRDNYQADRDTPSECGLGVPDDTF